MRVKAFVLSLSFSIFFTPTGFACVFNFIPNSIAKFVEKTIAQRNPVAGASWSGDAQLISLADLKQRIEVREAELKAELQKSEEDLSRRLVPMLLKSIHEEFQANINDFAKSNSQFSYYSASRLAATYLSVFPSDLARIKDANIWKVALESSEKIDDHLKIIAWELVGGEQSKIKEIMDQKNLDSLNTDPSDAFYMHWKVAVRQHFVNSFILHDRILKKMELKFIVLSVLPSVREMNAMLARGLFAGTITKEPLVLVDGIPRKPITVFNHDFVFHFFGLHTFFGSTKLTEFKRFQRMLLLLSEAEGSLHDPTHPTEIANNLMFILWHEFDRREPVNNFGQALIDALEALKDNRKTVEERLSEFFLKIHRNITNAQDSVSRPDAVDDLLKFFQELTFGENLASLPRPLAYPHDMADSLREAAEVIQASWRDVQ